MVQLKNIKFVLLQNFLLENKVDFDTFAPMMKISPICIFFTLTYIFKLFVHQINVKTKFLNSILEEEIFIE